jgi:hypothetical protein
MRVPSFSQTRAKYWMAWNRLMIAKAIRGGE